MEHYVYQVSFYKMNNNSNNKIERPICINDFLILVKSENKKYHIKVYSDNNINIKPNHLQVSEKEVNDSINNIIDKIKNLPCNKDLKSEIIFDNR